MAHWNFYYWSILLDDPKSNIVNDVVQYEDGKLECSFNFKSRANIHVPAPANTDISLDLNEESFHLLLAKGPIEENKIQIHELKVASEEPINLAELKVASMNE